MDAAPSSLQSHCSSNRFLHAYIPHTSPQVNGVAPLAPPVSHVTRRSAVASLCGEVAAAAAQVATCEYEPTGSTQVRVVIE